MKKETLAPQADRELKSWERQTNNLTLSLLLWSLCISQFNRIDWGFALCECFVILYCFLISFPCKYKETFSSFHVLRDWSVFNRFMGCHFILLSGTLSSGVAAAVEVKAYTAD